MKDKSFGEYIEYLRENIDNLVVYREQTGIQQVQQLNQLKEALFDEDPFVVFSATIKATEAFSDKYIFH